MLKEYLVKAQRRDKRNLDKVSRSVRNYLALQKIKDIFPEEKPAKPENIPEIRESRVMARAAFISLNGREKRRALVRYRNYTIGLGSRVDLDLSKFGHCNYVSEKHAVVYYDQFTKVYELINYSDHGTVVDNAVYALDVRPPRPNSNFAPKITMAANAQAGMTYEDDSVPKPCSCTTSVARLLTEAKGCENSAVLHHGSFLRMGCLQFVFSIMGSPDEEKVEEREKALEAQIKEEEIVI